MREGRKMGADWGIWLAAVQTLGHARRPRMIMAPFRRTNATRIFGFATLGKDFD